MLSPRAVYARPEPVPASYILYYVLFVSLLIATAAGAAATGRVTLSMTASLAISWMFVPVLHVAIAAALVWSSRAPRASRPAAIALLLKGHAPWSLWMVMAGAMLAAAGYTLYPAAAALALVPIALTCRIVHAFCREVLGASRRGALGRTIAHQALTWLIAAAYLDRAVSLVPRIQGWLQ